MAVYDNVSKPLVSGFLESISNNSKVHLAAASFSLFAFESLKKELKRTKCLEFIFIAPSFIEADDLDDKIPEFQLELAKLGEQYLSGSPLETTLLNKLNHHRIAQECYNWIENNRVTFKANVSTSPMQSFAVITPDTHSTEKETGFCPLPGGFTASALGEADIPKVPQLVSSLEPAASKKFLELFNIIWNDPKLLMDVTEMVKQALSTLFERNSPVFIYYVILFNIFSDFLDNLEEDFLPNDATGFKQTQIWQNLFNFQKDAAVGIINKLEQFNGCILADSVGLGKTYTALAVIKYFELRNKNVLVLAPKKLTANWTTYNQPHSTNTLIEDRFNYKVLAHTDLSRDYGKSGDIDLALLNWGNFDLVVIDESHNFRNPGTSQYKESRYDKLMRKIIREGVDTKVLMLSATPVNNKFSDLRNQLALAFNGREADFERSAQLTSSVETTFRLAQQEFNKWSKLEAEYRTPQKILKMLSFDFFELLDSVTIARSRKQIQRNYDTQSVGAFPVRLKPVSLRPPLTSLESVPDFESLNDELLKLNLAVYAPLESVHPSMRYKYEDQRGFGTERNMTATGRTTGLKKLMAVNLLKRLESSVEAFRLTLSSLEKKLIDSIASVDEYEKYLRSGHPGSVVPSVHDESTILDSVEGDDGNVPESPDTFVGGEKKPISLADMDYLGWRDKLESDLAIISSLLRNLEPVDREFDAKLQKLLFEVERKVQNPINEGNRKVLIFTAFADTADYLYDSLKDKFKALGLDSAVVTGSSRPRNTLGQTFDFQQTLTLFSPLSKSRSVVMPDEARDIDILIGTDCISEGQNLQDCDYLINYDIHWNPVRIIQRFGRIDRIGSKNKEIQLVNFWPSIGLDEYINLKERVEGRMVIADLAGTADDNILLSEADRAEADYRKQQLQKLQDEVLDLEDANTGVSITDLGLNDFRLELVSYLREFGSLESTPKGVYAVVPAREDIGIVPGAFFAVRDTSGAKAHRGNRLHPYYLLYVSDSGEQVVEYTDIKAVLDSLKLAAASYSEPISSLCDEFDQRTKNGSDLSHYRNLLQSALGTIDSVSEQREVLDLFDGTLGAKAQSIMSSKKHELIAFIAVIGSQVCEPLE